MQQRSNQRTPFIQATFLADAMDAQLVVVARKDALGAAAAQNVDDVCRSKTLVALRETRHTREQLLGFEGPVLQLLGLTAVVAGAAGRRIGLIEVAQLDRAAA